MNLRFIEEIYSAELVLRGFREEEASRRVARFLGGEDQWYFLNSGYKERTGFGLHLALGETNTVLHA